jgi:hypothetical protein
MRWEGPAVVDRGMEMFFLGTGSNRVWRALSAVEPAWLEQFQQKCEAVLRPELRKNKEIDHFSVSVKR